MDQLLEQIRVELHTVLTDVALIKERQQLHIERSRDEMGDVVARIVELEMQLDKLLREHASIKGQMRLLAILGGVIVGLAAIAEVFVIFFK